MEDLVPSHLMPVVQEAARYAAQIEPCPTRGIDAPLKLAYAVHFAVRIHVGRWLHIGRKLFEGVDVFEYGEIAFVTAFDSQEGFASTESFLGTLEGPVSFRLTLRQM